MQSRWAQIEKLLHEFQTFLAPNLMQLKVEKGIDCLATGRLIQECPLLGQRGVYLIFDEHESLMYIGSAATQPLLNRVRSQILSPRFGNRPRWIDLIPFEWKWSFFIPALELYLIRKVGPHSGSALVNKVGVIDGILLI